MEISESCLSQAMGSNTRRRQIPSCGLWTREKSGMEGIYLHVGERKVSDLQLTALLSLPTN